jgi:hypothetical protein
MNMIQSSGRGAATTISAVYLGGAGFLKLYAHHVSVPERPGSEPQYYMTELGAWSVASNPEEFQLGACALRNARDWAKEQRDKVIATNRWAMSRIMEAYDPAPRVLSEESRCS